MMLQPLTLKLIMKKTGFSKEGKHQNPQILLDLLFSEGGYALAKDNLKKRNLTYRLKK